MSLVCVSEPSVLRACVCETTIGSCDRTTTKSALSHVPTATSLSRPLSLTRSLVLPLSLSHFGSLAPFAFSFSLRGSHPGMQWMRPLIHLASYLLAREERLDRRTIGDDSPCCASLCELVRVFVCVCVRECVIVHVRAYQGPERVSVCI
jgi:hypothetical protein